MQFDNDFEKAFRDSDNLIDDPSDYFDEEVLEDINFSEVRGTDFKKSFSKVNRRIGEKSIKKILVPKGREVTVEGGTKFTEAHGRRIPNFRKQEGGKRHPTADDGFAGIPVRNMATIHGGGPGTISKVLVPRDREVIVEGVDKFILSGQYDAVKRIGYHNNKKLKEVVLIFNNDSGVDFNLEIFNPSMPLDYLYSTSLSLNDKIQVAGGAVSYSDVLFNILANPLLIYNAKFIISGPQEAAQVNQPLIFMNKSSQGIEKTDPVNLMLQIDNMQVEGNHISFFDIKEHLHRPFIPDGMDVIQYKVLAGNTITMCFYCRQPLLKNSLFEEARYNKHLI